MRAGDDIGRFMMDLTKYWFEHYATHHCTLCGNTGIIDTTGVKTSAGLPVGRRNWCVCPNGQTLLGQTPDHHPHIHDAPPGDCSCDVADRANGYDPQSSNTNPTSDAADQRSGRAVRGGE